MRNLLFQRQQLKCIYLQLLKVFIIISPVTVNILAKAETCNTEQCVLSAADLLKFMNRSVNPCQDFYQFACGKWEDSNPKISPISSRLTEMTRNVHLRLKNILDSEDCPEDPEHFCKAKAYYRACLKSDTREMLDSKLFVKDTKKLGGWPVLEGSTWEENNFNWIQTLAKMFQMGYNKDALLTVIVSPDLKNTTQKRIYFDIPKFGMTRHRFIHFKYVDTYLCFIVDLVHLLQTPDDEIVHDRISRSLRHHHHHHHHMKHIIRHSQGDNPSNIFENLYKEAINNNHRDEKESINNNHRDEKDAIRQQMKGAVMIERQLALMSLPFTKKKFPNEIYHLINVGKLMKLIPQVNWVNFINAFLPDARITTKDDIVVKHPLFLKKFGIFMHDVLQNKYRDFANFLFYRMAIASATDLPKSFRGAYFNFRSNLIKLEMHPPLWSLCIHSTRNAFLYSLSSIYVKNFFRNATKAAVNDMVGRIQGRLVSILQHVKWMDKCTRKKAIEKARHLQTVIGYGDDLLNDTMLNNYYGKVKIGISHYRNSQRTKALSNYRQMENVDKPINKTNARGHSNILLANSYYSPSLNTMNIPVAILQRIMFHENNPNYMNYGRLGCIVGHELTHAFDDKGAWYDKNGNWNMWWANNTYDNFVKSAQCLVNQYNRFVVPELNHTINGTKTLGENIADNCGTREAYIAYQKWVSDRKRPEAILPGLNYTANQLFWIAYATGWCSVYSLTNLRHRVLYDVHPPARNRILATVSNSADFARDFNCPKGSPLNPVNKCTVWI